jgi:uncharacterized protein DUF3300
VANPPCNSILSRSEAAYRRNRSGTGMAITFCLLWLAVSAYAQQSLPAPTAAPLTPQQLDDLVAPIALYPDPLVAQVLAASTYPIEIAEAEQWVRDHANWKPPKLIEKAKKENWDPSVQGLVAFREVLTQLAQDINWTTQLGNAFLAQQADVMQAVQRMRAEAQARGTLRSTPQQTVSTQDHNGQPVITIQPANPEIWYVPVYNPVYVWGPPAWGVYPPLAYPAVDLGWGWDPAIDVGLYFGGWGGWGWGGWGWAPNWYGGGIFVDHSFFHRYGFRDFGGGPWLGNSVWLHNPDHRLGVPYGNREVAARFGRNAAFGGGADRFAGARAQSFSRGGFAVEPRFGSPGFEQRGWTGNHSVFGGYHSGGMARMQSDRGFSSMGGGRSFGGFGGGMRGGGRR